MNLVVKLPEGVQEKILCFPFLHSLNEYYTKNLEEDDVLFIHLISNEADVEILNLLPFKAYYHVIPDDDLRTIFTIHRGVKNLKIIKTDIFLALTSGLIDALIGKNLKAIKSFGFSSGKNGLLLNYKIDQPLTGHFCERIYLLSEILSEDWSRIKRVASRELDPFYIDWREAPYSVVNLDLIGKEINQQWIDFFELFEGNLFVLSVDSVDINFQKSMLNDFIKKLSVKNTYKVLEADNYIDYAKALAFCDVFVSHDSNFVSIASYVGAQVFYLCRTGDSDMDNRYFLGDTVYCSSSSSYYADGDDFHYGKFFDEIYSYLIAVQEKR